MSPARAPVSCLVGQRVFLFLFIKSSFLKNDDVKLMSFCWWLLKSCTLDEGGKIQR